MADPHNLNYASPPAGGTLEAAGRIGPSYILDTAKVGEPALGDSICGLVLRSRTNNSIEIRAKSWVAAINVVGGSLLLLTIVVLMGVSLWNLIRWHEFHHADAAALIFIPLGGVWVLAGLYRFGLRFAFDAQAIRRTNHIGATKEWRVADVDHIRLIVVPYIKPYNEKLAVVLMGRDGRDFEGKEVQLIVNGQHRSHGDFGSDIQTRFPEAVAAARIAVEMARLMKVSVRVQGVSEKGTDEFKALIEGRGR